MSKPLRIVHYINQFFGGIGAENMAGVPPTCKEGAVGPGRLLEQALAGQIQVAATVMCGDDYFVEKPEQALAAILELIRPWVPAALLAGPAFASGRHGEACAAVSQAVQQELGIPVITGLAPDHPVLESYRRSIPIVRTGTSGADMKNAMPRMGRVLLRLARGEPLLPEDAAELYRRGLKRNEVAALPAAERAVEMLLRKHRSASWQTEVTMISYEADHVAPAPAVAGDVPLIALVTDGGLVLKGNPERMSSGNSQRWCRIAVDNWEALTPDRVEVYHYGYDTRVVTADPNRLVPLDAARQLEQAGRLRLHPVVYATAGVGTAMQNAVRFGREIGQELLAAGVQAVVLTST